MISNPSKWPANILPLRNESRKGPKGFPFGLGVIYKADILTVVTADLDEIRQTGSKSLSDAKAKFETEHYDSVDAMLDAGWVVD